MYEEFSSTLLELGYDILTCYYNKQLVGMCKIGYRERGGGESGGQ
jgi:hypothetical protein